jgi:hypothetical protein
VLAALCEIERALAVQLDLADLHPTALKVLVSLDKHWVHQAREPDAQKSGQAVNFDYPASSLNRRIGRTGTRSRRASTEVLASGAQLGIHRPPAVIGLILGWPIRRPAAEGAPPGAFVPVSSGSALASAFRSEARCA